MSYQSQKKPRDFRFEWKNAVRNDDNLKRSAKAFASHIVDEYVYAGERELFPKNEALASGYKCVTRTVKRHIRELVAKGWLTRSWRRGKGRVLTLSMPVIDKGDSKGDSIHVYRVTNLSPKSDRHVTPNKKHNKNHNRTAPARVTSTVSIFEKEGYLLENWRALIEASSQIDFEELLLALRNGSGYDFPSRNPPDEGSARDAALAYFNHRMRK